MIKRNKEPLYLALALLCVWFPIFMGAFDKDKPASSTSLRSSNPQILANWSALETALTQDHEFSTGGTNSGEHKQIKFNAPISTPTNAANKGWLYGKDVSSVIEFHWLDESGNELQLTSGGDLFSSTGLTVTSASTFNGNITLGAGDDLIGSSTSDITFNTDKFTVAGDTGNTAVAGTLTVTGESTFNNHINLGAGDDLIGSATSDITINTDKFTVAGDTGNTVVGGTLDVTGEATGIWTTSGSTVFNTSMTSVNTFQDLDLSGTIGSNAALVYLEVKAVTGDLFYACKPKGFGGAFSAHDSGTGFANGASYAHADQNNNFFYVVCSTDSSGVMQHGSNNNAGTWTIKLIGYIK